MVAGASPCASSLLCLDIRRKVPATSLWGGPTRFLASDVNIGPRLPGVVPVMAISANAALGVGVVRVVLITHNLYPCGRCLLVIVKRVLDHLAHVRVVVLSVIHV